MAQPQARHLSMLDATTIAFRSHPWQIVLLGFWLLALLWWVIEPWWVYGYGRPTHATVVDAWQTNASVNILFWTWRLDGVRLDVTLPDGTARQVKKYCRSELVAVNPLGQRGSQFEAKLDPFAPWRVVLVRSTCDFEQSFFVGLVLVLIGGYAVWKWGTK
jgi:hypothetical protein